MRISDWSSDVCSSDLRQRAAAGVAQAERGPLAERLLHGKAGEAVVEAGRQFHLTAPGAVAAPSFLREVVGRRGEDVRQVVPDVAVAVAVVVDGEVHEGRGNGLELAHGAGPGAGQDRKSGGEGKSGDVCVNFGGARKL